MSDRLVFIKDRLANGITVYHHPADVPYTDIHLSVPVGTVHNNGQIKGGSFHFLEHILLDQSKLFPVRNSFMNLVGLKGGYLNAYTQGHRTSFFLSIPTRNLSDVLPGFLGTIFEPKFDLTSIKRQRGIIANERQQQQRWYPGNNERGQFLNTKWQNANLWSLRQLFGSDEDLAQMTPTALKQIHQEYFTSAVTVVMGGSGDPAELKEALAKIKVTARQKLPEKWEPFTWVRQDYHEQVLDSISNPELWYGAFYQPAPPVEDTRSISFLLGYLTNHIHGPLFEWLRYDTGWLYNIDYSTYNNIVNSEWSLELPLTNVKNIARIRKELWPRVEEALEDTARIGREVDRIFDNIQAYDFQMVSDTVKSASNFLYTFGRIVTETEWLAMIEQCRQPNHLKNIYQKYFNPKNVGSVGLLPTESA